MMPKSKEAKNNKYVRVEGLLYSYKTLPYVIKGLELKYKETGYDSVKDELEEKKLTYDIVNNMIEFLKLHNEIDYQIIKLRYLDKLTWEQIEKQLHIGECQLMIRRKKIITEQLIAFV